jgi:hypothetical protein
MVSSFASAQSPSELYAHEALEALAAQLGPGEPVLEVVILQLPHPRFRAPPLPAQPP